MNNTPHSHELTVSDHESFWGIHYGDQLSTPDKPWRWRFWESDIRYAERCRDALRKHMARLVRKHDRISKAARPPEIPVFMRQHWASDQPERWQEAFRRDDR